MTADRNDLTITRQIEAPPAKVWRAWSDPDRLAQWWIPKPIECQVVKLDLRPGGGFETRMRPADSATFQPHVEGCFLDIVAERRLVWTTSLAEGWRPIEPWLALTAVITFEPEGDRTRYSARVMHKSDADARRHEDLGFQEGWGQAIDQLAEVVRQGD